MPQVGGDCTLEMDGAQAILGTSCTYRLSGANRERKDSMYRDGKVRFKSTYTPGMIEVEMLTDPNQDLDPWVNADGKAMTLRAGNGDTISGSNMTRTGEVPQIDAVEGTATFTFEGLVKKI